MARSALDPPILPEEQLQTPIAAESVTLETDTSMETDIDSSENTNDSSGFIPARTLALHQIQNNKETVVLDGPDQMMNPGANTPMSNAEILNLLMARQKQEEEERMKNQEPTDELVSDKKSDSSSSVGFQAQEDSNDPPAEFYSSLDNTDQQANYEDMSSPTGAVSLGENNITTIELPDGQILSLGEETLGQIAGLSNFTGGSIALATTQGCDGTQQIQYIIKSQSSESTKELERKHQYETFDTEQKQYGPVPTRIKVNGKGSTFTCYVCQKAFPNQSDLQKHTKSHLGQKEYVCEVPGCKKEYTTSHHLKVHQRQHSGERPFVCEWEGCGKMFTTGYGLKSHFRTHTNERPYKCQEPECAKAFKTSGDLQKHIRTHTGERPFVCPFEGCNRSFTTSNIRKVHLRTHTGEKPYKCEIEACGRTFASATNYKNHSRIHTGERPYVCEVPGCLKRFTEYSSLYKHNIVHTQQKPYTCTLCHKTYRQTSTLAMHKRTVHGTTDDPEGNKQDVPRPRRPKMSRNKMRQLKSSASAANHATNYLQGMSLVINNASGTDDQFHNDLTSHLTSSEIPGAIAIPIQVTMNPDGSIAGAQGLNLTDGSGRMIPVNLSVSIPMSSFQTVTGETITDTDNTTAMANMMNILTDTAVEASTTTDINQGTNSDNEQLTPRILTTNHQDENLSTTANVLTQTPVVTPTTTLINNVLQHNNRTIESVEQLTQEQFDSEEGDVTDKYLTSHFT